MAGGWKPELTITYKHGHLSGWEKVDDEAFLRQLFAIYEYSPLSAGELLKHAFKHWLKSREGQDVLAIVQGRKEIAAGNWHDLDDVIDEIQAIIDGTDPGDD